jgi:hypothetical protein
MKLFEDKTTNGDSDIFEKSNHGDAGVVGEYYFFVHGTWDGATVTIHTSLGVSWSSTDANATFTENGGVWIKLPREDGRIKATLAGGGGGMSLTGDLIDK